MAGTTGDSWIDDVCRASAILARADTGCCGSAWLTVARRSECSTRSHHRWSATNRMLGRATSARCVCVLDWMSTNCDAARLARRTLGTTIISWPGEQGAGQGSPGLAAQFCGTGQAKLADSCCATEVDPAVPGIRVNALPRLSGNNCAIASFHLELISTHTGLPA
jgi:hypothetical protein